MFDHFNHKLQTVEKWLQIPSNYSNLHSETPLNPATQKVPIGTERSSVALVPSVK